MVGGMKSEKGEKKGRKRGEKGNREGGRQGFFSLHSKITG
jgi:hypothetical protein